MRIKKLARVVKQTNLVMIKRESRKRRESGLRGEKNNERVRGGGGVRRPAFKLTLFSTLLGGKRDCQRREGGKGGGPQPSWCFTVLYKRPFQKWRRRKRGGQCGVSWAGKMGQGGTEGAFPWWVIWRDGGRKEGERSYSISWHGKEGSKWGGRWGGGVRVVREPKKRKGGGAAERSEVGKKGKGSVRRANLRGARHMGGREGRDHEWKKGKGGNRSSFVFLRQLIRGRKGGVGSVLSGGVGGKREKSLWRVGGTLSPPLIESAEKGRKRCWIAPGKKGGGKRRAVGDECLIIFG